MLSFGLAGCTVRRRWSGSQTGLLVLIDRHCLARLVWCSEETLGKEEGSPWRRGFDLGLTLLPIQSHLILLPCWVFVKRFDISPHLHSCCFISSNFLDNTCFQLLKSLHASFLDFFMFIPGTQPCSGDLTGPLSPICPTDILVKTKGRFNNKTLHFRAWDFLIILALIKFIFTPNLCLKSAMPFQKIKYRPLRAVGSEERREEREKRIGGDITRGTAPPRFYK